MPNFTRFSMIVKENFEKEKKCFEQTEDFSESKKFFWGGE